MTEQRALKLFELISVQPGSRAASGRYQRSVEIKPGIRYWATSLERKGQDRFGVQFRGRGTQAASVLEHAFSKHKFRKQSTDPAQVTFCKDIPYNPDGTIDSATIRSIRSEIDAILAGGGTVPPASSPATSPPAGATGLAFLEFMRASPLYGVELDLPKREGGWRDVDL